MGPLAGVCSPLHPEAGHHGTLTSLLEVPQLLYPGRDVCWLRELALSVSEPAPQQQLGNGPEPRPATAQAPAWAVNSMRGRASMRNRWAGAVASLAVMRIRVLQYGRAPSCSGPIPAGCWQAALPRGEPCRALPGMLGFCRKERLREAWRHL